MGSGLGRVSLSFPVAVFRDLFLGLCSEAVDRLSHLGTRALSSDR